MANSDNFDDFSYDGEELDTGESTEASDTVANGMKEPVEVQEEFDAITEDTPETETTDEPDEYEDDFTMLTEEDKAFIREEDDQLPQETETEAEEDMKSTKRRKKKGKKGKFFKAIRLPLTVALIVIVAVAAALFGYSLSTIDQNRIMNNVYIENLNVSGLTYEEALASINKSYLFEKQEITLVQNDNKFTINGREVGLTPLPEETATKAVNYCKDGNVFQNAYNAFMLLFNKHTVMPAPKFDEALLDEKLKEAGKALVGERVQFYAEYNTENVATVKSGKTGFDDNIDNVKSQLMETLNKENFDNVQVNFTTAPPDEMTMANLDALIYKDPIDARYEYDGNNVSIIEGENGRYIDKDAVAPLISQIYEGCQDVEVPYMVSTPNVTGQTLKDKLFANTLATYSTSYGGSTENRKANIAKAASNISGTVVQPGAVFSFNDTVGPRSRANGFYTAKEYINGESVDGIGGGTCQVSSTLYSAVLYADMGIVERLNHMMSVGYIPLGQDATVSDGGVDFKFKNSSDYPVKIVANTNGSTITITILGTSWEPARKVEIRNSSSTAGENTVVRSTRYVYAGGKLINTESLNSSTYMPHKAKATSSTDGESDEN